MTTLSQNLGWTAMSHACLNGDADMVAALIEGGANVNTVDKVRQCILAAVWAPKHAPADT